MAVIVNKDYSPTQYYAVGICNEKVMVFL